MHDFFAWLFSADFMPHGHCYLWQPAVLWLNVASDALIAGSYFAIPVALYYFVRSRKAELPYAWLPLMFAGFILLCGATHVMEIITVWHPVYRFGGVLKALTGIVSFVTMLSLFWIMPQVMKLKTDRQLQAEVNARTQELKEATDQLKLAAKHKDEFLATLAHELRNPLAPIRSSLKLVNDARLAPEKQQLARDVISRQVQRMAVLLDDLLEVSRISRGQFGLKIETVELQALISSALETAAPLIEAKGHLLTVLLPDGYVTLNVDSLRLSQAISNLLINAAKFTGVGGQIGLTVEAGSEGVKIIVTDTGIGFENIRIKEMFEMFTQVATPGQRPDGGLGIGLALVKGIVALHEGSIEAQSAGLGQGSSFTIELPAGCIAAQILPPPEVEDPEDLEQKDTRCKVLITDDNKDLADTMAMALEMDGYVVKVAYSGPRAIESGREEAPDAVILDIGMPDMTGYEVAKRIRQESWGKKVFLVAMTGWGGSDDKLKAREAGFDQHLTKPVDPQVLEALLARFMRTRNPDFSEA